MINNYNIKFNRTFRFIFESLSTEINYLTRNSHGEDEGVKDMSYHNGYKAEWKFGLNSMKRLTHPQMIKKLENKKVRWQKEIRSHYRNLCEAQEKYIHISQ